MISTTRSGSASGGPIPRATSPAAGTGQDPPGPWPSPASSSEAWRPRRQDHFRAEQDGCAADRRPGGIADGAWDHEPPPHATVDGTRTRRRRHVRRAFHDLEISHTNCKRWKYRDPRGKPRPIRGWWGIRGITPPRL